MEFLKSSKGKFIVTVSAAPIIFFLILYFVMGWLFTEIRNASYSVSGGEASLIFLDKRAATAEENKKAIEGITRDIERMKRASFNKEHPLEFIETLENIARLSGGLVEITPVEDKNSLNIFLVSAVGNFPNIFKFLKLLEVMPYEIFIEEANFEKNSSESSSAIFSSTKRPSGGIVLNLTIKTSP